MEEATELQRTARVVTQDLASRLGENLYSCILYGSAARGEVSHRDSDINLLIVLTIATPEAHAAVADVLTKHTRIEPFVLGLPGLERSKLAFAIKFRSIQRNHVVLHGPDLVADFSPNSTLVRFLCEQSIRNLRLRLTHAYITIGRRDAKRYTRVVLRSLAGLIAAISEVLLCEGIELPRSRPDRVRALEKHLQVDASIITELLDLKKSAGVLSAPQVEECHARLYRLLTATTQWMEAKWPTMLPL
jgi:predicted nucleotidyltransferase